MRHFRKTFLIFFLIFCISSSLVASSPKRANTFNVDRKTLNYNVVFQIEYLEDAGHNLSIEEITSPHFHDKFILNKSDSLGVGFTNSAYWFRFTVANNTDKDQKLYIMVDFPLLDQIDFFVPKNGGFTKTSMGDKISFYNREINYSGFVLPVQQSPGSSTYYIRVFTSSSMSCSVRIFTEKLLMNYLSTYQLFNGVFYGLMIIMLFFNFFLWFTIKNRAYLYFVMIIFSYICFELSFIGHGFQFVWPALPILNDYMLPLSICTFSFFSLIFFREFLKTKNRFPKVDLFVRINIYLSIIGIVSVIFVEYRYSVIISIAFGTFTVFSTYLISVGLMFKKSRYAKFYSFGNFALILGVGIATFRSFAIFPDIFISRWGLQIGSTIMVVVVSIGLIDKINQLRKSEQEKTKELNRMHVRLDNRSHQLEEKVEVIHQLSETLSDKTGYLTEQVKETNEGILSTAAAINAVAEQTSEQFSNVQEVDKDMDIIMEQFNDISDKEIQQLEELNNVALMVKDSHNHISNQVNHTKRQSKELDNTKIIIDEMMKAIEQISAKSHDVSVNSIEVSEVAKEGGSIVQEVVDGMDSIQLTVSDVAQRVEGLGSSSQRIEEIIEVIDNLSSQTNLLSLNAAIEAARAGEHGLGFAVVADEVRFLAEKSVRATKSITEIIRGIRSETNQLVRSMEVSMNKVQNGHSLIQKLENSFELIVKQILKTVEQIQEISAASEEMYASSSNAVEILMKIYEIIGGNNQTIEGFSFNSENIVYHIDNLRATFQKNQETVSEIRKKYQHANEKIKSVSSISENNNASAEEVATITEEMSQSMSMIETFIKDLNNLTIDLKKKF